MKYAWMLSAAAICGLVVSGCGVGNAPEPMSSSDVKSEVDKLSPEQQIDWYQRSPMPPEEKQKKINEIKQKAGMPIDEGPAPAPGVPTVPGGGSTQPPAGGNTGSSGT